MSAYRLIHHLILFSAVLTTLSACSGQITTASPQSERVSTNGGGALVEQLGDSLWYVFQDKSGNYWFGSDGQGVFKYDGISILNFTTEHGLSSDSIRQILEDDSGNMYFSTLGGINKYDGKMITRLDPIKSTDWKLEANDLWFYMIGRRNEIGPYRYDGKNLYNLEFPKHFLHDEMHERGINPFFSPYEVYCIYKDRRGAMWFGTSVFGACRFDGQSVKWMYERDLTIVPNGGSFGIRSIYEDVEGNFWLCNTEQRFRFDEEKTASSDRLEYDKLGGIGNAEVFGGDEVIYYSYVVEDNQGDLWFTTWSQGVYRYDGENITNYPVMDGSDDVNLVSMYKDSQGVLWLGTLENGAFRFNGETFVRFNP